MGKYYESSALQCVILLQQILTRTQIARKYCCNNKCCWCFSRSWFLLPCHSYLGIYSHFFLKHCTFCRDFILFDSDIFCGCAFHPLLKVFQHMLFQSSICSKVIWFSFRPPQPAHLSRNLRLKKRDLHPFHLPSLRSRTPGVIILRRTRRPPPAAMRGLVGGECLRNGRTLQQ